ncbi:acyl-CoA thioesterase [Psychroflexus sp. CAK1W]|uniref:acyl-CoA thioesterase n=1 Tax=Psychroflexus curvus TaxID=2873595 RepID=UPI001CCCBB5D|nr:thioesterase family protein [Psychroflexus curvus]MBZ9627497.1 acyl-CoA thioesterase [Psychroflexus curvus]
MSKNYKEIRPIFTTSTIEVRYAETDQMGVVHHSVYPIYFEQARVDWLRIMGMHYQKMEDNGVMLPINKLNVDYKRPAKFGDVLRVKTGLYQLPGASITFDYEIRNQKDELLTLGQTVLVFVNQSTRKPIRCPGDIMNLIVDAIPRD